MENLFLNSKGENFAKIVSQKNVGKTIKIESTGQEFRLLKYFVAQAENPEKPFKNSNKTQITIKWLESKKIEAFPTDNFRSLYCPEYVPSKHEGKTRKFEVKNLHLATDEELQHLITECSRMLQERKEERENTDLLKLFKGLTTEQKRALLNNM